MKFKVGEQIEVIKDFDEYRKKGEVGIITEINEGIDFMDEYECYIKVKFKTRDKRNRLCQWFDMEYQKIRLYTPYKTCLQLNKLCQNKKKQ